MTEVWRAPSLAYLESEVQRLGREIADVSAGEGGAGVYDDDPRLNQTFVASTTDEIRNQLLAASGAGGGTVVIAGQTNGLKTYTMDDIVVPSNVRLVTRGGVLLQCPANSDKRMLSVPQGARNVLLESLTFDHTPGYHGTVYYGPTTTPDFKGAVTVMSQGEHCYMQDVEVRGSALDAIRFAAGSKHCGAEFCRVYDSDRFGISGGGSVSSPTETFVLYRNDARRTYASAFGANGPVTHSWFLYNDGRDTGGSGDCIAAYGQYNTSMKVIGNHGSDLGNNGTHVAARDLTVKDNSFIRTGVYGIFAQASDRTGETAQQVNSVSASIDSNHIERSTRQGVHIGYYNDVDVGSGNRIINSGMGSLRFSNCDDVSLGAAKLRGATGPGVEILATRKATIQGTQISGHSAEGVLGRAASDGSRVPTNVKVLGVDINGGTVGIRATSGNRWVVSGYDIRGQSGAQIDLAAVSTKSIGSGV